MNGVRFPERPQAQWCAKQKPIKIMKKYLVLKIYSTIGPNVMFQTDIERDAKDYARIMHNNDPEHEYVAVTCEIV